MKLTIILLVVLAVAAAAWGLVQQQRRSDAEVRADSALAGYQRLVDSSAVKTAREHRADSLANVLRSRLANVTQAAKDSIHYLTRLLASLDVQADTSLSQATNVRDSMVAYRDAYVAQREATGRLLAAAALVSDSLLNWKDQLLANREDELLAARTDRDLWKAQAGTLAHSVTELKHPGKLLGFLPRPSKLVAGVAGCLLGGLLDTKDRARGCGLGGTAGAVLLPTKG